MSWLMVMTTDLVISEIIQWIDCCKRSWWVKLVCLWIAPEFIRYTSPQWRRGFHKHQVFLFPFYLQAAEITDILLCMSSSSIRWKAHFWQRMSDKSWPFIMGMWVCLTAWSHCHYYVYILYLCFEKPCIKIFINKWIYIYALRWTHAALLLKKSTKRCKT